MIPAATMRSKPAAIMTGTMSGPEGHRLFRHAEGGAAEGKQSDQHRDQQPLAPGEGAHYGPHTRIQRAALHGHRQKAADDEHEQRHVGRLVKALNGGLEHLEHSLRLGGQLGIAAGHRQQALIAAVIGHCGGRNRLLALGGDIVIFARRQHPGKGRHQGDDDEQQCVYGGELALLGRLMWGGHSFHSSAAPSCDPTAQD